MSVSPSACVTVEPNSVLFNTLTPSALYHLVATTSMFSLDVQAPVAFLQTHSLSRSLDLRIIPPKSTPELSNDVLSLVIPNSMFLS